MPVFPEHSRGYAVGAVRRSFFVELDPSDLVPLRQPLETGWMLWRRRGYVSMPVFSVALSST